MHQKEHLFCYSQTLWVPKHSMYAIYAYIGVVLGVNVGIYGSPIECLGYGGWTPSRHRGPCRERWPRLPKLQRRRVQGATRRLHHPQAAPRQKIISGKTRYSFSTEGTALKPGVPNFGTPLDPSRSAPRRASVSFAWEVLLLVASQLRYEVTTVQLDPPLV